MEPGAVPMAKLKRKQILMLQCEGDQFHKTQKHVASEDFALTKLSTISDTTSSKCRSSRIQASMQRMQAENGTETHMQSHQRTLIVDVMHKLAQEITRAIK